MHSEVFFPDFYCPIESAIHPEKDRIEQRAIAWMDRFQFCSTEAARACAIASSSAEFYARFAPYADADRVLSAACWVYWGFSFDDERCDEGPLSRNPGEFAAMAGKIQRVLEVSGDIDFPDPYAAALHDIGQQFRRMSPAVQVKRFLNAHRAWLFGVQWQIGNRSLGYMPDTGEYITMRLHSAGGEPTYAMLEIANGIQVPQHEMFSPAVSALTEMAILVAALDNDRHSFAKELSRQQAEQNIFTVLAAEHKYGLQDAVYAATALRDRVLCRFIRLRDTITPGASQELRLYLEGLGHGIRGNAEWGLNVRRYLVLKEKDALAGEFPPTQEIHWAEYPADGSNEPLPIPEISWWWDDLKISSPSEEGTVFRSEVTSPVFPAR